MQLLLSNTLGQTDMIQVSSAFKTGAFNYTNESVAIEVKLDCSHLCSKETMDMLVVLWSNNDLNLDCFFKTL